MKNESQKKEVAMNILKSFGYALYDVSEYGILYRDKDFKAANGVTKLIMFKDWNAVTRFANEISK